MFFLFPLFLLSFLYFPLTDTEWLPTTEWWLRLASDGESNGADTHPTHMITKYTPVESW